MKFLLKILVTSLAVIITAYLLKAGIHVPDYTTAIVIAIVLTLLNIFLKPILILLTIPATIFSLGLFLLVVNAFIIFIRIPLPGLSRIKNLQKEMPKKLPLKILLIN